MDFPQEEGTYVISPLQVTNISCTPAALTVNLEGDEPAVPKASHIEHLLKAQPIASVSVPLQSTYLLPSFIKSKVIGTNLERIRTMYGIPDEYQMRVANPQERADWRSLGWVYL